MRAVLWTVLALGCDAGAPAPKKTTTKPIAPGPYVVHYDCFHSDEPFGHGTQSRNTTYDLGRKTVTLLAWETKGDELAAPPDQKPSEPPKPVVSELGSAHLARLEAAVAKVLSGGPYKPEYPVPEGTPCTLLVEAAGAEVFKLEKDAATDLVLALAGP